MVQDVYNYFILKMKNNQSAVDLKNKFVCFDANNQQYISFDSIKKTPEQLFDVPVNYIGRHIAGFAFWASGVSNFRLRDKFCFSEKELQGLGLSKNEDFSYRSCLARHILNDFNNKSEERQVFIKFLYNCQNYGYPDYYYWRLANWGCRGNSMYGGKWRIQNNKLYLYFETANHGPHLLFDNYQNENLLSIKGYYHCPEPDDGFLGCVEYFCKENISKKFNYHLVYYPLEIDIDKIKKTFSQFKNRYFSKKIIWDKE